MDNLKKLYSFTLARYILVGGISYAIELSFLYGILYAFHTTSTLATAIAFWIGLIVSFVLQKLFAFSNRVFSIHHMTRQTLLYSVLVIINYSFTLVFVYAFRHYDIAITRTAALIITTAWNFVIYKYIIFRKSSDI